MLLIRSGIQPKQDVLRMDLIQGCGTQGESKILSFWFWCKSREWRLWVQDLGLRFSCVNPGMERFSLDLPKAVKKYALEVGCGIVWNSKSQDDLKKFFFWLSNLKLGQAMRNLACDDQ